MMVYTKRSRPLWLTVWIRFFTPGSTKQSRRDGASAIWQKVLDGYADQDEDRISMVKACIEKLEREIVRTLMREKKIRVDGREFNQIRNIECRTGFYQGLTDQHFLQGVKPRPGNNDFRNTARRAEVGKPSRRDIQDLHGALFFPAVFSR